MEYLILVFVFGPLGFILLVLVVNEVRKKTGIDPKYGFAREQDFPQFQKYNDNHKHYTKLAEDKFDSFIDESNKSINKQDAKTEAGKYRHAHRRALALFWLSKKANEEENMFLYFIWVSMTIRAYNSYAPSNAYGKVELNTSSKQILQYVKKEQQALGRDDTEAIKKPIACIYIGEDIETGKKYIGQTVNAPEKRWAEHREAVTGPYKGGCKYPKWDILKGEVPTSKLDYYESFYIGFYDALHGGFNDNKGNDSNAYDEGVSERLSLSEESS
ncbi:MAG: GIY-YIG nuclease family protein [Akkermansiaceae bacterium]|jgi:hypothetical protein|nr:GIY-YIG nuclease family protein [Akkermansiaceae bacterium]